KEWLVHRKQADVPVDKRDGGSGLSGGGMPWIRPPNVGGRRARRRQQVSGEGRFTSVGNTGVGDSDRRCRFTDAGERLPVEVGIDSVARFAIDPFIRGAMPDLVIGGIAVRLSCIEIRIQELLAVSVSIPAGIDSVILAVQVGSQRDLTDVADAFGGMRAAVNRRYRWCQ